MYGQVQRKDVKLFVDMAGDSYDIDSAALEKEYEESENKAMAVMNAIENAGEVDDK